MVGMTATRVIAWQVASVAIALAGWEAVARAGWVDPLFVPAPSAVALSAPAVGGAALGALADTLGKTAVAYALSAVLGVACGLVLGSRRTLETTVRPFVTALYGMPKILVLPWIVLLLGYGGTPAVVYGTLHGFFPVVTLVAGAVRDVDGQLLTVARSFGAGRGQLYLKVIVPAIVPALIASLRLAAVFCLLGVLVVEMFAGLRGMGSLMGALANGFRAPELFAATALVSAASIAIVLGLDALNERLSRWR
jgi:ABC-type nitrate/sulfonate/bicarbonate transport system permease component